MLNDSFDAYAGLHMRNLEAKGPNIYGNALVCSELAKRGVGVYLTSGKTAFDVEAGTATVYPVIGEHSMVAQSPKEIELVSGLDVVRSRIATPRALEDFLPVLNGAKLREIGASKWRQYEVAGEYMPKTVAVEAAQDPSEIPLDELSGDKLVVKADYSQDMQYMKVVERPNVVQAIEAMRLEFAKKEQATHTSRSNKRILIQEYARGINWPSLVPVDEKSSDFMSRAQSTEVRLYSYVDAARVIPTDERHFATGRSFHDGRDDWFSIEQASVPPEAWAIADTVSSRLLNEAGVRGGYFAIDIFQNEAHEYMIREINTRDPIMLSEQDNAYDSRRQRQLLAGVMATLAKEKI